MMTQRMRTDAALTALVYPTIYVLVFLLLDFARDLKIDTHAVLYGGAWFVFFFRDFFRIRRNLLKVNENKGN